MAMQVATVALAAASSGTFNFNTPVANYGKNVGLTITDGLGGVSVWFTADVNNGNGTSTGTINLSSPVTGTAEITIWDKP